MSRWITNQNDPFDDLIGVVFGFRELQFKKPMKQRTLFFFCQHFLIPPFFNQFLHKSIGPFRQFGQTLLISVKSNPFQNRHEIDPLRSSSMARNLLHKLSELPRLRLIRNLLAVIPFSGHDPHHGVETQFRKHRFQLHLSERFRMEFDQQSPDFILPNAERRVQARRGEDLHSGEATEVPPVVAVRGGGHGGAVVAEVLADE
ncbi:unnamed protein product [Citrullus colocynthis]|uniref:Uncharacterized protein n=1 Tax=Citrullus colocynthis TaxID=252529 RepID=A0ABP0Y7R2_9ROSI